jgi:hypothetical protein
MVSRRKKRSCCAIGAVAILGTAILPLQVAQAVAACSTTQNSYVGNGTNGTNGTNYTTFSITQTGSCTWTVPNGVTQADVLIVGGGGTTYTGPAAAGGFGGSGLIVLKFGAQTHMDRSIYRPRSPLLRQAYPHLHHHPYKQAWGLEQVIVNGSKLMPDDLQRTTDGDKSECIQ